jgi:hypothetical protein
MENDFWDIALISESPLNEQESEDESVGEAITKSFTVLAPKNTGTSTIEEPLTISIQMNNSRGVLDDVSGIPWDASLLLAGYLYGTHEGRRMCCNALEGGILEMGSGLGLVGLAATAATMKLSAHGKRRGRIVLTDRNDHGILSHLRENVDTNVSQYRSTSCSSVNVSVEACDWMEVSSHLRSVTTEKQTGDEDPQNNFPRGPFNLILGSALIYLPEHAIECADTIYYYLSNKSSYSREHTASYGMKRQAIIVQLPDRSGFATHFLPRCQELGLNVVCEEFSEELIERVESGVKKTIASVRDYRMYFITEQLGMQPYTV